MSYFRITLLRSGIGLTKRTKGVLRALGLRTRMKTVFLPVSPEAAGQIMRVKELVSVAEVEKELTREELKAERRPDPGFFIEKAVPR
ncbi:54S ribosomal protein L33, mitochondrial [Golovinomyces cichoracearum]|uniref:Large ribosomal subunit protein uL30m n=1 Tax=Golovinomyces cichoracearum TaxID=62708 RepID=A0A420J2Y2_9PEZI|nr:54S ribosomal protein L33, mitochondrial [Golovinomyces cichoracearum]RKF75942.1 54S ribosomal protein L33, mitochondrial [Golovinomyces cichoracearum]RKF81124.1 54S ribosomal protein L33, mitochondrial [Golovinomyces cichoracearum]